MSTIFDFYLRGKILGCPTVGVKTIRRGLGETEIGDLDHGVVVLVHKQDVLRLDIPVYDLAVMQVLNSLEYVLHQRTRIYFVVMPECFEAVKEVTSSH